MQFVTKVIKTPKAMQTFGKKLAKLCATGCRIYFSGELGAGKTTLIRGILRALGHVGHVKSPTFTLLETYILAEKVIYHFDLYRLKDPVELEYIGARDYFSPDVISFVEWPEYGKDFLPEPDFVCKIIFNQTTRIVEILPISNKGKQLIRKLK
ncbi:MAG: tRNA (adenosine(37)-N6)-threonylcarbamoyltransferase complex ATPase subunit type 1 TsaE [Gammaproteobacteria bacterium]|nr:tRNA (adenosine(37)-N6)-threonylcarbamoyltransferase complex ATPase subunit type 1 TsaE [Gammaproteobacteria bacterium]